MSRQDQRACRSSERRECTDGGDGNDDGEEGRGAGGYSEARLGTREKQRQGKPPSLTHLAEIVFLRATSCRKNIHTKTALLVLSSME